MVNNTQGPPSGGPLEKKIDDYQIKLSYIYIRLITCKILCGVFNDNDIINKIGIMMTKIMC